MDEKILKEVMERLEKVEAVNACRNLMGRYSYYHTAFRNYDYMTLWAKREDSYFKFPYGEYRGYDAIYHCYCVEHGDRSDPGMENNLKGMMMMHQLDTEVIEVAADGKTAKGCWVSPGHETVLRAEDGGPADKSGDCSHLKADPMWAWSKYEVEFIKEDDGWKLWHMKLYPLFKTNFYTAWTDGVEVIEGATGTDTKAFTGQEPPKFWQWDKNAIYPADEPEPPVPYNSYEDMPHKIMEE